MIGRGQAGVSAIHATGRLLDNRMNPGTVYCHLLASQSIPSDLSITTLPRAFGNLWIIG